METFIIPLSHEETYYGQWLVVDVAAGAQSQASAQMQTEVETAVASVTWGDEPDSPAEVNAFVSALRSAITQAGYNVVSIRTAKYATMSS